MRPIVPPRSSKLCLLVDLNETLIRTGELSQEERLTEATELSVFVKECRRLAEELRGLRILLVTGNSYEYSRRIEEPLGLKNIPGADVVVVSENGLLARSFTDGDLWRLEPTAGYHRFTEEFLRRLTRDESLRGKYYTQGNEIRLTLKPTGNAFLEEELQKIQRALERTPGVELVRSYLHRFYADVDPKLVEADGREATFEGKKYAARRLLREEGSFPVSLGDSASDLPMHEATLELGGRAFWVGNGTYTGRDRGIEKVSGSFTAGVNQVLRSISGR